MDWTQAFAIMGVFIAAFLYMMSRLDSNQKENNTRFNSLENRMTGMEAELKSTNQRIDNTNQRIDSTNQRIGDFKTDMNQRLSTIEGYLVPRKVFHFEEPDHKDDPKEN